MSISNSRSFMNIHRRYPARNMVTLIIAMLVITACKQAQQPETVSAPEKYPVAAVSAQEVSLYTDFPASIRGEQDIEIRPKIEGYLDRQLVDEGASVKKGQLLFVIKAPQYQDELLQAEAAIRSARSALATATMEVAKVKPLVDKGIINHFELEAAMNQQQSREAELAQALAVKANASTYLGYTAIHSPVDGLIGNIPYKVGSLVSAISAEPLTTVSNITRVHAYFSFSEKQFLHFFDDSTRRTIRQKIEILPAVSLVLANGNLYTEKGRIETVGGMITGKNGTIDLRAIFPNPAELIRSGATAVVRMVQKTRPVIIIPKQATYEAQGKYFVFVVDKNNQVKKREVILQAASLVNYYLQEKGLENGDRIVLDGIGTLKEGMKIIPEQTAMPGIEVG